MSVSGPTAGPCSPWISGADAAECCDATAEQLEGAAAVASEILFELSGRKYPGLCDYVVRPCRAGCSCWGSLTGRYGWDGSRWADESCGDKCGCSPLSRVKLAGYPVREITEVKIDGVVVDPATYRLDGWRWLVRLDDLGPPVTTRAWPSCQHLGRPDTEDGTFLISYRAGIDPPAAGIDAATELACEIYKACGGGGECKLPNGTVRATRQGVTIEKKVVTETLASGKAGLVLVNVFMQTYGGRRRRTAIWSPDVERFPLRVV